MKSQSVLCAFLTVAALVLGAAAADTDKQQQDDTLIGTLAVDPVALVAGEDTPGREDLYLDYQHYRYLFASEANRDAFKKEPAKYEIQMGGACARMGPLSGRGSTDIYAAHRGRVYIFASEGCRTGFLRDPDRMIEKTMIAPSFTDVQVARGRELIELMLAGMGGAQRVDALRTIRWVEKSQSESNGRTIETVKSELLRFPDEIRTQTVWDGQQWSQYAARDSQGFTADDGNEPMLPAQRQAMLRRYAQNVLSILRARNDEGFVAAAVERNPSVGVDHEQLIVFMHGTVCALDVDPESGRVTRMFCHGRGSLMHLGLIELRLGDVRDVDGLQLPHRVEAWFDGKRDEAKDRVFTDIILNEAVDTQLNWHADDVAE